MNRIIEFNVSTKKNETQTLRFLVVQNRPHPRVSSGGGPLRWENCEGLFPAYQRPATGLKASFTCYLLAPGDVPEDYNRRNFAGFKDYHTGAANPGTMVVCGKDLGEMTVDFSGPNLEPSIRVQGGERPTPAVGSVLRLLVVPPLQQFIRENSAELHADAKASVLARMQQEIAETRKELDALEAEIEQAVF